MKICLPFMLVLLFSACDSSKKPENKSNSENNQTSGEPSKELIGKTVDEYQKAVTDVSTPSNSSKTTKPVEGEIVPLDEPDIIEGFKTLKWEGLVAPGFDVDSILKKYEPIVSKLEEGSDEANKLYEKMQAEYNKAPPNQSLANKKVSIPGFIAPLEQKDGVISEFLLVPYFGACIHSPAPPANQTVHVKVASKDGISVNDAYDPIWVSGELLIDKSTTDIGTASYKVEGAKIQKYEVEN